MSTGTALDLFVLGVKMEHWENIPSDMGELLGSSAATFLWEQTSVKILRIWEGRREVICPQDRL